MPVKDQTKTHAAAAANKQVEVQANQQQAKPFEGGETSKPKQTTEDKSQYWEEKQAAAEMEALRAAWEKDQQERLAAWNEGGNFWGDDAKDSTNGSEVTEEIFRNPTRGDADSCCESERSFVWTLIGPPSRRNSMGSVSSLPKQQSGAGQYTECY